MTKKTSGKYINKTYPVYIYIYILSMHTYETKNIQQFGVNLQAFQIHPIVSLSPKKNGRFRFTSKVSLERSSKGMISVVEWLSGCWSDEFKSWEPKGTSSRIILHKALFFGVCVCIGGSPFRSLRFSRNNWHIFEVFHDEVLFIFLKSCIYPGGPKTIQ